MNTPKFNEPAFPLNGRGIGLTKRELFAKDILCTMIGTGEITERYVDRYLEQAINLADRLLIKLENTPVLRVD